MGSDLDNLEEKIRKASASNRDEPEDSKSSKAMSEGMRAGSEFLAHVFGGTFLGYLFDYFLGTLPWGMIVFCLLGFATGVYSANRSMNKKP